MTSGFSLVGWISEAHPPLKTTTIILHRAKNEPPVRFADTPLVKQGGKEMNPLRHSARSETELQNLLFRSISFEVACQTMDFCKQGASSV